MKKISYHHYSSALKKHIPVIDMHPYSHENLNFKQTAAQIRKACKQIGFFYISNHGVSKDLQKSIFQSAKSFFSLPLPQKKKIDIHKSGLSWKGYFQYGFEYTSSKPDLKEGIWYGRELNQRHQGVRAGLPFHGSNPFPNGLPNFKKDVLEWLRQMDQVGGLLSMALADSLGLDRRLFVDGICKDHLGTLGIMQYPPQKIITDQDWGVGKHSDYGFLTLLMFDEPRLEAEDVNGNWIEIQPIPDTFVVNVGDILEVMTKGLYKSTPHRAQNTSKNNRIALPYFYDMNWHTRIQALDISISREEQSIIEKVKKYKRWDQILLHQTGGIYGHYVIKKLMKAFPESLQKEFGPIVG